MLAGTLGLPVVLSWGLQMVPAMLSSRPHALRPPNLSYMPVCRPWAGSQDVAWELAFSFPAISCLRQWG